jgi:EpsD family peptidyl-prolyl cis-trans isomerase
LAILAAMLVAACGGADKEKPATQTAAKVNKEEITVHQINALLAQQRAVAPEQVADAGRRALERLIDQELAVQKAVELKLDRDPRVMQRLEAARRDIVAAAYAEKLGEGAPRPTTADIKRYYDEHPALFSQRKVYQLRELNIQAEASQIEALGAKLAAAKNLNEFSDYLKANNVKFTGGTAVRSAEQLPLAVLPKLAALKDGASLLQPTLLGAQVVQVVASRPQPVDLERASRAIEQFLLNERKRVLMTDDLKALRAAAKIEYKGQYAAGAVPVETLRAPTPAEVAASAAASLGRQVIDEGLGLRTGAAAASAVEAADAAVRPASGIDAGTVSKGLGLK